MTQADPVVPVPPPPTLRRRPSRAWKWVGLGCLLVVLLFVMLIGSCTALLFKAKKQTDPAVERFFTAYDNADYEDLYAQLGHGMRGRMSKEEALDWLHWVRESLGKSQSRSATGVNWHTTPQGSVSDVTCRVTFERDSAVVRFSFMRENDEWRINNLEFESQILDRALRCPNCGEYNEGYSKFCPHCGKEMR